MASDKERIEELKRLISESKYNKATQHAIGRYKAQLAKLKEKVAQKEKGTGDTSGYHVEKTGDATVVLLGFPSAGKSTLLNKLTGADSEIGAYDFTTLSVEPGVLKHRGAEIQILDVPGIVEGASQGKGRGKEVLSVLRSADLVAVIVDATQPERHEVILDEIYDVGIRLDEEEPDVKISKKAKDGLSIASTVELEPTEEQLKEAMRGYDIPNADVVIRDPVSLDQFIDCIEGNKHYVPSVTVLNKADLLTEDQLADAETTVGADISISAAEAEGLDELKELFFDSLDLIRVYMKEPREDPDFDEPLIVRRGADIRRVCESVHQDVVDDFRHARVWGESADFDGQRQGLDHVVCDEDVVEVHTR
jgi:small GTP-binding protein